MACFVVPAVEAIATVVAAKAVKSKEENEALTLHHDNEVIEQSVKIPFSRKLRWLTNLLFGGSVLLAFEHLWHGEVVPWFPFLTAASDPASASEMLHEMATVGVSMTVLVTLVWVGMLAVAKMYEKRALKESALEA